MKKEPVDVVDRLRYFYIHDTKYDGRLASAIEFAAQEIIDLRKKINPPCKMMTLQEAANAINRSSWTLRRDYYAGKLAAVRFCPKGKLYIKREDLDAYLPQA